MIVVGFIFLLVLLTNNHAQAIKEKKMLLGEGLVLIVHDVHCVQAWFVFSAFFVAVFTFFIGMAVLSKTGGTWSLYEPMFYEYGDFPLVLVTLGLFSWYIFLLLPIYLKALRIRCNRYWSSK